MSACFSALRSCLSFIPGVGPAEEESYQQVPHSEIVDTHDDLAAQQSPSPITEHAEPIEMKEASTPLSPIRTSPVRSTTSAGNLSGHVSTPSTPTAFSPVVMKKPRPAPKVVTALSPPPKEEEDFFSNLNMQPTVASTVRVKAKERIVAPSPVKPQVVVASTPVKTVDPNEKYGLDIDASGASGWGADSLDLELEPEPVEAKKGGKKKRKKKKKANLNIIDLPDDN